MLNARAQEDRTPPASAPAGPARWLRFVCLWLACTALAGCASLPPLTGRAPSTVLRDDRPSRIAAAVAPQATANPGLTAVYPLPNGTDAFIARALLAAAADRSLDVQYYIWRDDVTGWLLLDQLWRAAERGVRVRLLLDDNGVRMDSALAALDAHRNIEVRLFNPFAQRGLRALGYLTDFDRLNRRMHNKSLTADGQVSIVGGRNVGDEYFGAGEGTLFADLDVLAAGPVAAQVGMMFDAYWNSDSAYPVVPLLGTAGADATAALTERMAQARTSPEARAYVQALERAPLADYLRQRNLPLTWCRVDLVYDAPVKGLGRAEADQLLVARLAETLGSAQREVDIVSPYFVPGERGTAALVALARKGVRVRVVTNSLAASDVAAVHSGYARRRAPLLQAGVELHEMKPDPALPPKREGGSGTTGSSGASLHAKTFAVDGQRVFVGSFNFDPRSVALNTEMGVVIHSPALAEALRAGLDGGLSRTAYRVQLEADGSLIWIESGDAGVVRHTTEPRTGWFKRFGVRVLELLPIEGLL